ncbi:MAG: hypothetical protein HQK56_12295 [Deltaproteobacteria bacterium]|nr:hypothetical protein [Deltaproteobacteria bacterium]
MRYTSNLEPEEQLILYVLASSELAGAPFASLRDLAISRNLRRRRVERILATLVELGLIMISATDFDSFSYSVTPANILAGPSPVELREAIGFLH